MADELPHYIQQSTPVVSETSAREHAMNSLYLHAESDTTSTLHSVYNNIHIHCSGWDNLLK